MATRRDRRGLYATRDDKSSDVWLWRGCHVVEERGVFQSSGQPSPAHSVCSMNIYDFRCIFGLNINFGEGPVKLVAGRA